MRVLCALINVDGTTPLSIKVNGESSVSNLFDAIIREFQITAAPHLVRIYRAKLGEVWVSERGDKRAIARGARPDIVQRILEGDSMDVTDKIAAVFTGVRENALNVLVVHPIEKDRCFRLVNRDGTCILASRMGATRDTSIRSFVCRIKAEYTEPADRMVACNDWNLADYAHAQLHVYESQERVTGGGVPLDPEEAIGTRGESSESELVVVVPTPRWRPAQPPVAPLLEDTKYLKRLDMIVEELCDAHHATDIDAAFYVRTSPWIIPVAGGDGQLGIDTTVLCDHYIRRCRDHWPASLGDMDPKFQARLTSCRTIHVSLPHGSLRCDSSRSTEVLWRVYDALARSTLTQVDLAPGVALPGYLKPVRASDSVATTVEGIVARLGHVFIVLEDIDLAFADVDGQWTEQSYKSFYHFCWTVLTTWMQVPGVFLMLTLNGAVTVDKLCDRKSAMSRYLQDVLVRQLSATA